MTKNEKADGCAGIIGCVMIMGIWAFNLSLIGLVLYVAYHFISKVW